MAAHDVAMFWRNTWSAAAERGCVRVEGVRLGSSNRQWRNDLPVSALGWAPTALDTGRFWWLSRWWFPTVGLEIGRNNLNLTPLDDNLPVPGKPAGGDGTTAPSFTLTSLRASPSTFSSLHRGILRGPSVALKIFPQTKSLERSPSV